MALTLKTDDDEGGGDSAGALVFRPRGIPARRIAETVAECRARGIHKGADFAPILQARGMVEPSRALRVAFPSAISEAMAITVALNKVAMRDMAFIPLADVTIGQRVDIYARDAAVVLNEPDRFRGAGLPNPLCRPIGGVTIDHIVIGLGYERGFLTILGCHAVRAGPMTQAFFPGDRYWSICYRAAEASILRGMPGDVADWEANRGGPGVPAIW